MAEWELQARCRDHPNPDGVFFSEDRPGARRPEDTSAIKKAKGICGLCPVREECLQAGLDEVWGVWGGMSAEERRWLRSEMDQRRRGRRTA